MDSLILKSLATFLEGYGMAGFFLIVIIVLILVVLDEDRSALCRSWLYKLAFKFTESRSAEKKYISNDINGRINLARRNLNYGGDILPRSVSVEWTSISPGQSYDLEEGEFVVRLDPANRQESNI